MVNFIGRFVNVWKHSDKLGRIPAYSNTTVRPRELAFVMKEDTMNLIRRFCKIDLDKEIANALDIKKSYFSKISNGKAPLNEKIMLRIIGLLGLENRNWAELFDIIDVGEYDGSHQKYNGMKQDGIMPYRDVISAAFRAQDGEIDVRQGSDVITIGTKVRHGRQRKEQEVSS